MAQPCYTYLAGPNNPSGDSNDLFDEVVYLIDIINVTLYPFLFDQ
jgi:hypothetical protein